MAVPHGRRHHLVLWMGFQEVSHAIRARPPFTDYKHQNGVSGIQINRHRDRGGFLDSAPVAHEYAVSRPRGDPPEDGAKEAEILGSTDVGRVRRLEGERLVHDLLVPGRLDAGAAGRDVHRGQVAGRLPASVSRRDVVDIVVRPGHLIRVLHLVAGAGFRTGRRGQQGKAGHAADRPVDQEAQLIVRVVLPGQRYVAVLGRGADQSGGVERQIGRWLGRRWRRGLCRRGRYDHGRDGHDDGLPLRDRLPQDRVRLLESRNSTAHFLGHAQQGVAGLYDVLAQRRVGRLVQDGQVDHRRHPHRPLAVIGPHKQHLRARCGARPGVNQAHGSNPGRGSAVLLGRDFTVNPQFHPGHALFLAGEGEDQDLLPQVDLCVVGRLLQGDIRPLGHRGQRGQRRSLAARQEQVGTQPCEYQQQDKAAGPDDDPEPGEAAPAADKGLSRTGRVARWDGSALQAEEDIVTKGDLCPRGQLNRASDALAVDKRAVD